MSNDGKQDFKKGLSNSFIWFLMAAFFLAFMVQSFIDTKIAKVSFSYQLEHLINLQLIQPEDSRKIALNDNLVTFSGKFRDRRTDEGKKRFKFLELLNENHQLKQELAQASDDLKSLRSKVIDSAQWYLQLTGVAIPSQGFIVIDDFYSTSEDDYSVVIRSVSSKKGESLKDLKQRFDSFGDSPSYQEANDFGNDIITLVRNFRSPLLGIGNQGMKLQLKKIEDDVEKIIGSKATPQEKMESYHQMLALLKNLTDKLNTVEDHVRLSNLRSIRSYKEEIDIYSQLVSRLEDNQIQLEKAAQSVAQVIWFYNNQELSTKALEKQDPEVFSHWFTNAKEEWNSFDQNAGGFFKAPDQPLNLVLEKRFKSQEPAPNYFNYLFTILPFLLVVFILYFIFSRQMKGMNTNALNFGKSPARLMTKDQNKITFKDVAGLEEEVEELQEIVDFLKNPKKFTALGGRIPKGVLLVGPPGTGKTLIGKAVAGEANRPFFSISGSDFVEMFVGVGASRIRDMFDQAKKNAPCIIFIDEIDAVGRHRGAGIGGGHDEREQTLNQLLVEMDGFDTNEGVILMAATNRPDVLDKALLRPGRFDRRIIVNLPDVKGRFEILKVHAKRIKLDPSVDLMKIARATPGCSGADLANILNEAALLAARKNRTAVTAEDTAEARDKVLYGKERRSLELDENEKLTTAYHEAGHAIVSLHVEHADPVDKVTIIPRGMSLGATMFLPKKNRVSYWRKELVDRLAVLMGGRAAEDVFVNDFSSGAKQDIEQATSLAHNMICQWGMSDKMGAVFYGESSDTGYYGIGGHYEKHYSEETAKKIDDEMKTILHEAYERAKSLVIKYKEQIELMTSMLIKYETLSAEDVLEIANDSFDENKAIQRRKEADEAHKKKMPTPPPLPQDEGPSKINREPPQQLSPDATM
ncbi:ATP-dependent zinc metalloprotease FtsH [Criblamydia sequanensis]|uniref:ATP-dependent zinc metalloprotease FtsH n=1 Tax=Candidatus Criblamydia sequanensis CRIB-18 TaxID=1437425 RepID=A0A090D0H7_9BACT|nr:ATP-dependent zinc metalloprotease FtsH [Criblamydia sequanensis]CDR33335.1 ATP-dependent zinc metalloprotease FtsH [Criblamydia sequanensis CRIB-18]